MGKLETLTKAREILSDPARWTQKEFARDSFGYRVEPVHKSATCFCSLGAMKQVCGEYGEYSEEYCEAVNHLLDSLQIMTGDSYAYITLYNDNQPHHKVIEMFDHAISRLTKESPPATDVAGS